MADISVGAAIGAGFDLIRRKPLTVVSWGLVQTAFFASFFAVLGPFYIQMYRSGLLASTGGHPPDPGALMPQMLMMQGVIYLFDLVSLLVSCVLYCAAFRAVLHPEQGRFGYLRLGSAELLLIALYFGVMFVGVFALLIVMVPFFIIIGILAATHLGVVAGVVGVVGFIALFVGMIYVALRFAFVGPMIVDDGKFHLFDAWPLTKGRVGSLFLIALALFGLVFAAEIVFVIVLGVIGVGAAGAIAGGFNQLSTFFQQPPETVMARLSPLLVVLGLLWIPAAGCLMAIFGAPWARAYRDVRPSAADAFT